MKLVRCGQIFEEKEDDLLICYIMCIEVENLMLDMGCKGRFASMPVASSVTNSSLRNLPEVHGL